MKEYQIPFLSQPLQQQLPREIHLSLKGKFVVVKEIGNLLKSIAIEKVHMKKVSAKSQFVSNLFLVKEKDRSNRPVISLKNLNQYIPLLFENGEPAIIEGYPQTGQLQVHIFASHLRRS